MRPDSAFDDLVRPCVDRLFRTALLMSGDWQQAEDLVQITLAKLYARGGWQRITHPAAYLRQTLVHECISLRRRRSAQELVTGALPHRSAAGWVEADSAAYLDLFRALSRLSRTDRTVVVLRYWDDLSVAETADLTGLTPGAVRTRSGRALATLRALLTEATPDPSTKEHHEHDAARR
jgi:RNA polymerase sigma-70 factor (sigma-E family)